MVGLREDPWVKSMEGRETEQGGVERWEVAALLVWTSKVGGSMGRPMHRCSYLLVVVWLCFQGIGFY